MYEGEWLWLYDDLLSLPSGGFQGGNFRLDDRRVQFLYKYVPIVILKKTE